MNTKPIHPLRRWLFERQMTLDVFAVKSGICKSMLSEIMTRKKMPSAQAMLKIRKATRGVVTPNDLVPEARAAAREKTP